MSVHWTDAYEEDIVTIAEVWDWVQEDMFEYRRRSRMGEPCEHMRKYKQMQLSSLL